MQTTRLDQGLTAALVLVTLGLLGYGMWAGCLWYGTSCARWGSDGASEPCFRAAATLGPWAPLPHHLLAERYLGEARYDQAIHQAHQALRLQGRRTDPETHRVLVRALAGAGRLSEATDQCRAAIEQSPQAPGPHLALARLLASLGRHREAIAEYRAAWCLGAAGPATLVPMAAEMEAEGRAGDAGALRTLVRLLRPGNDR